MNKQQIAIEKFQGIVVPFISEEHDNKNAVLSLTADMMQLGFILSQEAVDSLSKCHIDSIKKEYSRIIGALRKLKGADVEYTPMYPNFPQQVMEADALELFLNAIIHYWSFGTILPDYEKEPRAIKFEQTKFIELGLVSQTDFNGVFTKILESNDSISNRDKEVISWFFDNRTDLVFPESIPFKENMCYVAMFMINRGDSVSSIIKTATDVLRLYTALSGGDISLSQNTKFISLPRKTRRIITDLIISTASQEDIAKYRGRWTRAFHMLHPGDHSKQAYELAKIARDNVKIVTYSGELQSMFDAGDYVRAADRMVDRPGIFARRLDEVLRKTNVKNRPVVIELFLSVVDDVSSRVLLQLLGHLKTRNTHQDRKFVMPKGQTQKAQIIHTSIPSLPAQTLKVLIAGIQRSLIDRFKSLPSLGKVYIDEALQDCPLPTQQRSVSDALFTVARGTKIPLGDDKETLRLFIYWKGQDIDLSATFHDAQFKEIDQISYTNLRSGSGKNTVACHSGDITRAPNGASEFIDININKALESVPDARYVSMQVYVYCGPTFAEHEVCYAGWMTREHPESNEIYDPKTVEQKIDVNANSKRIIPIMLDLVERKIIWCDLAPDNRAHCWGNNTESNRASSEDLMEFFVTRNNKVSLHDLFSMHAEARADSIVIDKQDADIVFSISQDADITPYSINDINAHYIA